MTDEIRIFPRENGEHQRVHVARLDSWEDLDFLKLPYAENSLSCFSHIYRQFLVPACPWLFGNMILFHIPEDVKPDFPMDTGRFGTVCDPLTAAAAALRQGVKIVGGKPRFRSDAVKRFWEALERRDAVHIVSGKLPVTTVIPVSRTTGYLTETEPEAAMKVNASFFIMDRFDCATVYDQVGTILGLCVKDGVVQNPPLYDREALLVRKDGTVEVRPVTLEEFSFEIGGKVLRPGENCTLHTRPRQAKTPGGRTQKLVIIGTRVAAVTSGAVDIPASGFVLSLREPLDIPPGTAVTYRGMEDITFGIQVGNSILRDGEKTLSFRSRFYNLRGLEPVPYPPSLYPLDFEKARAARIALGADISGAPMILWAEGAAKLGHTPGADSCGASLSEMAQICQDVGMVNAINLDGGGSAQLLIGNKRSLCISDRNAGDHGEAERPVPLGLIVR